ncbi:MAG: NUDIX hydrolase [Deltaproteobacteria bacterium]|nr:NUDIX hydrolase [Deltaproteobacteria bacterium]MBW1952938.1 NUDIX hydrolase [Deltaproteobacteria bacterium]MBW1986446.1 NUDIX hydrolase [Deltaproteobacteria bacterium]MBW2135537.1 NUDIX hydrolase [Deltaproteobacteria bacterium]
MKRHYPDQPIIGVGAVIFKEDRVLVVRRGQEPGQGSWSLPGGAVEVGESLEAALIRELMEETSLTVEVLGITAVLERIYRDGQGRVPYHYVLIDYVCQYRQGPLRTGSDITDARFVLFSELADYQLADYTATVIRRAWEQYQQGSYLPQISS